MYANLVHLRLLLPFVLLGVVIAAVAVFALSGGDEDDPAETALASPTIPGTIVSTTATATPSPTATLETAPDLTPTPELKPEEQARSLALKEAPEGMLEFVTDGPYVVPGDALGVFYINIQTQAIEGWYDLIGGTQPVAFSGENRFTLFQRAEQAVVAGTIYPAGFYLGDRQTRKVYRWDGSAQPVFEKTGFNAGEIAARGDLVLFRVPVSSGDDWFSLLNVRTGRVTAFRAEGQWALISRDASHITVLGNDVSVVDVAESTVNVVDEGVLAPLELSDQPGRRLVDEWDVDLVETGDGESFVFAVSTSSPELESLWQRYSWGGEAAGGGTAAKVYVSADGSVVAAASRIPSNAPNAPWHSLEAIGTSDGMPRFRVVGVDEQYGWTEGDRWLAGGSGVLVRLPDHRIQIAKPDGSFAERAGAPSPQSPDVFDIGAGVSDAAGKQAFQLSFQGGIREFVDAWGDRGDEVRILTPHLGRDGPPFVATIIEPNVERAPYDEGPQLQLSEVAVAFGLLNLYEEPGGETAVGQVEAPYRVTVDDVTMLCSGDFDRFGEVEDCPGIETNVHRDFMALVSGTQVEDDGRLLAGVWAHVTTPDGDEGWILLQVQGVGL